jgi:hypothetical protein
MSFPRRWEPPTTPIIIKLRLIARGPRLRGDDAAFVSGDDGAFISGDDGAFVRNSFNRFISEVTSFPRRWEPPTTTTIAKLRLIARGHRLRGDDVVFVSGDDGSLCLDCRLVRGGFENALERF